MKYILQVNRLLTKCQSKEKRVPNPTRNWPASYECDLRGIAHCIPEVHTLVVQRNVSSAHCINLQLL